MYNARGEYSKYGLGPVGIQIVLQQHCALKYAPGAYLTFNVALDYF